MEYQSTLTVVVWYDYLGPIAVHNDKQCTPAMQTNPLRFIEAKNKP